MKASAEKIHGEQGDSPARDFHIVTDLQWIWESFKSGEQLLSGQWNFEHDLGLWPIPHLGENDALWIDPASLVANNAWRAHHGQPPILLLAPPDRWLDGLSQRLLDRPVAFRSVAEILDMRKLPEAFSERPWAQPAEGRISGFRAARRSLAQLQHDLLMGSDHGSGSRASTGPAHRQQAPEESIIRLEGHITDITEEWMVAVAGGVALAASPYCIHQGNPYGANSESEEIVTIFDLSATREVAFSIEAEGMAGKSGMRHFDEGHRSMALGIVGDALTQSHVQDDFAGMIDVAFRAERPPVILEIAPLWCSGPYGFSSTEQASILKAVASGRVGAAEESGCHAGADERTMRNEQDGTMKVFTAGPWMRQHYAQRYIR
ncbi:hypothetical protein [Bifidobacterium sp.]|uniref:hypothetical protein n=1 Tax=Bifidobacterium sp. TaxID=41200 RepID=UPI0039EB0CA2